MRSQSHLVSLRRRQFVRRDIFQNPKGTKRRGASESFFDGGFSHTGRGARRHCHGAVELISGDQSRELNRRLHCRYLSASAIADVHIGPVFESFDDVTLRLMPSSWIAWDMAVLDAQAFDGRLGRTPGYMLPLD